MTEMTPPETAKRAKPKAKLVEWRVGANTFDNTVIVQVGGKPTAINREAANMMVAALQTALKVIQ